MSNSTMNTLADESATPKKELVADLQMMVADAEELINATASQTGEVASLARSRIQKSLEVVKSRLHEAEAAVRERARQSARAADQYVHANPWQSIGISVCAGIIVGMLIRRH